MTEDRRHMLVSIWQNLYAMTCRCGRCDCVSSDPRELARRVTIHWSLNLRDLARMEQGWVTLYVDLAKDLKKKHPKAPWAPEQLAVLEGKRAKHEREARRYARSALRYERLGRGLPPFVHAEGETT